jgi:hypothetical protein
VNNEGKVWLLALKRLTRVTKTSLFDRNWTISLKPWRKVAHFACVGEPCGIPLIGLTPPHCCACLKLGPGFPTTTSCVVVFLVFSEFSWEVIFRFVDIGGIVDHHCFKLSFHNFFFLTWFTMFYACFLKEILFELTLSCWTDSLNCAEVYLTCKYNILQDGNILTN